MRHVTQPALIAPSDHATIPDDIIRQARRFPDRVLVRRRVDEQWIDVTAGAFLTDILRVAAALTAAGIQPHDRVGIMSRTRYEWTVTDYAIWYVGGISVPIYPTSAADQVAWICQDAQLRLLIGEGDLTSSVIDDALADCPEPPVVWDLDSPEWHSAMAAGELVDDSIRDAYRSTSSAADIATIIYTSGTTGRPKGCVLTHRNLQSNVRNVVNSMPELFCSDNASTLLFLPLAHVFGRIIQIGALYSGTVLGHSPDIHNIRDDLAGFQPTFLLAVPRVFEKLFTTAQNQAAGFGKRQLFNRAVDVAIRYSSSVQPSVALRAEHALFETLVYSKIRSAVGGHIEWAVSGGAPLGSRLGHFFRGAGITILEGYGLTETAGASTVNIPSDVRIGTVGIPIPGTSVGIADDGEVLLRGPHVFGGYWNNPDATAEVFDDDGWFHTGDIGVLDREGYLSITGRKKEIIITAGGKNMAPAPLEDIIRSHFLVSQCMVVGDEKPYIAALIVLDPEALALWCGLNNLPGVLSVADAASHPQVRQDIGSIVDEANRTVSRAEAIKRFTILPAEWTEDSGHLTPSLKVKRHTIAKDFAADIDALYPSTR